MKRTCLTAKAATAFARFKIITGMAVLGLVASLLTAGMSSPAYAIKLYQTQNGGIPCSSCHSKKGMIDGTMYPLTSTGTYYKTNNQLPPPGYTPPYNPPTPPYNPPSPPYNPPSPPYNPPTPPYNPPSPPYNPPAPAPGACGSGYTSYDNTDYRGNDIDGYDDTFASCKRRCERNWRCLGFSWIKTNARRSCWLKHTLNNPSYKGNVLTCVKQ